VNVLIEETQIQLNLNTISIGLLIRAKLIASRHQLLLDLVIKHQRKIVIRVMIMYKWIIVKYNLMKQSTQTSIIICLLRAGLILSN